MARILSVSVRPGFRGCQRRSHLSNQCNAFMFSCGRRVWGRQIHSIDPRLRSFVYRTPHSALRTPHSVSLASYGRNRLHLRKSYSFRARMNAIKVPASDLLTFCRNCLLAVGVPSEDAQVTAENLLFANLRGVD